MLKENEVAKTIVDVAYHIHRNWARGCWSRSTRRS